MNERTTMTNADEFLKLAELVAPAINTDDLTGVALRLHDNTHVVSLERLRTNPSKLDRCIELRSAREFCDYVQRFTSGDLGAGFASLRPLTVSYALDYGTPDAPRWAVHRANYAPCHSPQFLAWQQSHKRQMSHPVFAQFIEERLPDIVSPDAATMMEVALNFQASGTTNFSSSQRLQSGDVQFAFSREVRGSVKQGQIEVPAHIGVRVPLYEFHEPIDLMANLRFRVNDGALSIWYEFVRLDEALGFYDTKLLEDIRKAVPRISLGTVKHSLKPATNLGEE